MGRSIFETSRIQRRGVSWLPLRITLSRIGCIVTLVLLLASSVGSPAQARADGETIPAGIDLYATLGVSMDFNPGSRGFLPGEVFGPGCTDPGGSVTFDSKPLGGEFGPSNAIIERLSDVIVPVESSGTTDIRLTQFNLAGGSPIDVACPGGLESWNVEMGLSLGSQPVGTMDIFRDSVSGGFFTIDLSVSPLLTFTRVDGGAEISLDLARTANPPINLNGSNSWSSSSLGARQIPGQTTPNFFPGGETLMPMSLVSTDPATGQMTSEMTGVFLRTPAGQNDQDGDSVPDDEDRCSGTLPDAVDVDRSNGCAPDQLATITVEKVAWPTNPQDFNFSINGGTLPQQISFLLDDDDDNTDDLSSGKLPDQETFKLPPGEYQVGESVPSGWDLESITCLGVFDDPEGKPEVTVTLNSGANTYCIFRNFKLGNITIAKNAEPDHTQDFKFSGDLGSFTLDDDGSDPVDPTERIPNFKNFERKAGFYEIREEVLPGWLLTDITCLDPTSNSSGDVSTATAAINLDPGEQITCTFTNYLDEDGNGLPDEPGACPDGSSGLVTVDPSDDCVPATEAQEARITIIKDAIPDDEQDFQFRIKGNGIQQDIMLDDDDSIDFPSGLTNNYTALLPPGDYAVGEVAIPLGWRLVNSNCTDPDGGTTGNINAYPHADGDILYQGFLVDLDPGEHIFCTFTNQKDGLITVTKEALPDHPQDFTFDISYITPTFQAVPFAALLLDDDNDPALPKTWTGRALPGLYRIEEGQVPLWNLKSIVCNNPSGGVTVQIKKRRAEIDLKAGESIACFFNNELTGPDHYLGYDIGQVEPEFEPRDVFLRNQSGIGSYRVFRPLRFYNPVSKNDEGIIDRGLHYMAYQIQGSDQKRTGILMENQFGRVTLDSGQPLTLMVPAAMGVGPDLRPKTAPEDMPFKCSSVTVTNGAEGFVSRRAKVEDQFVNLTVTVYRPLQLCEIVEMFEAPARANQGPKSGLWGEQDQLICYQVSSHQVPISDVHTLDQFGPLSFEVESVYDLCVPSEKLSQGEPVATTGEDKDHDLDGEPVADNDQETIACVTYRKILGESTTRRGGLGVKKTAWLASPLHCTKKDTEKDVEREIYIFFTGTAAIKFGDGTKSTSPAGKLVLHCTIDHENDTVSCYWGTGFNSRGELEGSAAPAAAAGTDKKSFDLEVTGGTITSGGFGPNAGNKHQDEHKTRKSGFTHASFQFGGSK